MTGTLKNRETSTHPRLDIKEEYRLSDHFFLAHRSEEKPGQAHACHDQKMPEKSETDEQETCL